MIAEEVCEMLNTATNFDTSVETLFSILVPSSVHLGSNTPLEVYANGNLLTLNMLGIVNACLDDRDPYRIEFNSNQKPMFQVVDLPHLRNQNETEQ